MRKILRAVLVLSALLVALLGIAGPAGAQPDPKIPAPGPLPDVPVSSLPIPGAPALSSVLGGNAPGLSDCKEAPTPESPGQGVAGFFSVPPHGLPPEGDPFKEGSNTTIYEQYGYAGLRYRTYDLGCGPDAVRQPDAVIGTAVANWIMQPPVAFAALTGSVSQVAFNPTFLDTFDPVITRVSTALHDKLFASWIPVVLAILGGLIIFKARRSALSSTAGAIGWALIILMVTTALFRWPIAAGHAADETVTGTLGTVVGRLDGQSSTTDPGMAVSSQVHSAILYRSWLAGTFGDPDSPTAKKYGPDLFKSQALTWREAAEADKDPDHFKEIVEAKKKQWTETTEKIKNEDPEAYEHLTGKRSETRVGFAIVSGLGVFLALPFLLLSALLMLGCFLIVRLAVMMFPAFALLGALPASRGLVIGLGRTVGAAVVNSIVFGIGAGVTIAVLGILFHPGGGVPGWLSMVLMPLFSYIMWVALKPFRRLTTMVNPNAEHFGMTNPMPGAGQKGKTWAKQAVMTSLAAASGGASAGAAAAAASQGDGPPQRAEAQPGRTNRPTPVLSAATDRGDARSGASPGPAGPVRGVLGSAPASPAGTSEETRSGTHVGSPKALPPGFTPRRRSEGVPPAPAPTDPEWYDGEEVYPIYHPSNDEDADEVA
ncbi:hypothetical protein EKO23_01805 [Nocardioides guangzhouensis]|uniref:MFS transporter n=1 Tax=Nocardioides guangzhouensis TaxID=2497878 RepID=A0A4V1Y013_9ACTN|nr:hypothetical protein [Nocardioides guangzhouensis]RYP88649.1 hypothetical protein EKO23_01805 [Nocardioides guangzhouensis]